MSFNAIPGKAGQKNMFFGDLKTSFMVGGSSQFASGVHHFLPPPIFITDDYSLVFFSPTGHFSVFRIHFCWQSVI